MQRISILIIGEMDEKKAFELDNSLRKELREGRMTTTRQAFIPNLTGGILATDAMSGTLMVQPEVVGHGRKRLMDDIAPMAFLYVTSGMAAQDWMMPHAAFWKRLAGARIALVPATAEAVVEGVMTLTETGNTFASWSIEKGVKAVIVRPDRYIYAMVRDEQDMAMKLALLAGQLGMK